MNWAVPVTVTPSARKEIASCLECKELTPELEAKVVSVIKLYARDLSAENEVTVGTARSEVRDITKKALRLHSAITKASEKARAEYTPNLPRVTFAMLEHDLSEVIDAGWALEFDYEEQGGRPPSNARRALVIRLAQIYEAKTGNRPRRRIDSEGPTYPFLDLVLAAESCLPDDLRTQATESQIRNRWDTTIRNFLAEESTSR